MSEIKKLSDEFSAGGQPTAEDLKHLVEQGYKSVVNLRSPTETGVLADEQQQVEALGLQYVNIPLQPTVADRELRTEVVTRLEELPTPVYFHCGAGGRANSLALITLATQANLNREQVLAKAQELGINPDQPHIQQFLADLP